MLAISYVGRIAIAIRVRTIILAEKAIGFYTHTLRQLKNLRIFKIERTLKHAAQYLQISPAAGATGCPHCMDMNDVYRHRLGGIRSIPICLSLARLNLKNRYAGKRLANVL